MLGDGPAQLPLSRILGLPRSGGTLWRARGWALCRGAASVGNHVPRGPGALREARVEARGSGSRSGQLSSCLGAAQDRAPKPAAPRRLPVRRGVAEGADEPPSLPPSPEQMVPRQQAAPSASITRAAR